MRATILGAHQAETANFRFTAVLVDDALALDAGGLASTMTLEQQLGLRDILISHHHWDHVKDLPAVGYNMLSARDGGHASAGLNLYCTDEVYQTLTERLFVDGFWMNLFRAPSVSDPVYRFRRITHGEELAVGAYTVRSIPTVHSVPVTGFEITDAAGRKLYFTSDNGPGAGRCWAMAQPDVLITECTYSNERCSDEEGQRYGHLCPRFLRTELEVFRNARGYLPRIVIVHVNPFSEAAIREELAEVAHQLSASIDVAREGQTFEV